MCPKPFRNINHPYHIRSREIYLKANFPSAFQNIFCPAPHSNPERDDQIHLYKCPYFSTNHSLISRHVDYEEIYGTDVEKQIQVMTILFERLEVRKQYLSSQQGVVGTPFDPGISSNSQNDCLGIRKRSFRIKKKTRVIKR